MCGTSAACVTSETDPAGNTSTISNDEAGRPVVETGPAALSQTGSGRRAGYRQPGQHDRLRHVRRPDPESSDPDGNVTTYAYDQDGQQVSVTDPSYTPPGASTPGQRHHDDGLQQPRRADQTTDPLGNITQFGYDQLGDLASQTDPGSGVSTFTYDPAGEQTSVTDPTGAQTQATYDNLGHLLTATNLVRQNASAAYTTSYGYNDAGEQISQTSPTGVQATATYDAVGEQTSVTDGAGNTSTYAYNLDGNLAKMTLPDGTATTASFDLAGR